MNIALIGPAYPYKGGIAQHTTQLAHQLTLEGHQVTLVSWKAMYPKLLYPGDQYVPNGAPEVAVYANTKRVLNWKNPAGWMYQIRTVKSCDLIIFVWWVPTIQGPVYLSMLQALGKKRPQTAIICHNILPHEPRPGDRQLVKAVFNKVDRVIVHTEQQAAVARRLTKTAVVQAVMPAPPLPPVLLQAYQVRKQLLFFGIVRPYKGLDILLHALKDLPGVKLTVVGEFWNLEKYQKMIVKLQLSDRVILKTGYLANTELAELFAGIDALVLPYKAGSATSIPELAYHFERPVIATTASSLAQNVHDGVDGLLCAPNDSTALRLAIATFYEPGVAKKLQQGVTSPQTTTAWQKYSRSLLTK